MDVVDSCVEGDMARPGQGHVGAVDADDVLVVDLENGAIVGGHHEFVIAGVTNPESSVIVDAKPGDPGGDAGNSGGSGKDLIGDGEGIGVDGGDGIEFAKIRKPGGIAGNLVDVAAEGIRGGDDGAEGADWALGWSVMSVVADGLKAVGLAGLGYGGGVRRRP